MNVEILVESPEDIKPFEKDITESDYFSYVLINNCWFIKLEK